MTRIKLYANIGDDEVKLIDRIAEDLGYTSRTELITDVLHALAYGKNFHKETAEVNEMFSFAERYKHLREEFMNIIDKYAFPVVAMQGAEYAFKVLKEDLKTWMYERCNAVPQEADMKEWLKLYAILRRGKILQYRIERMTENYREDREGGFP